MPLLILTYLIQIFCAFHALRRGANYAIVFLILAFPFIGCLIYLIAVLIPQWRNSQAAYKVKDGLHDTINPNRRLQGYADALEVADTVENKTKLADEFMSKGDPARAVPLYWNCLEGVFAEHPEIMMKLARAQFATGDYEGTQSTLDELIAKNPDYRSDEGHLLYARSLEGLGEIGQAMREYETLCQSYSGPEAKCRYGVLLKGQGRTDEAALIFREVLAGTKHVSPQLRKRHKRWLDLAQAELS